jgi:hypothetical protein
MIRERLLHQGNESNKAALPWRHFLAHHAGMATAEKEDQTSTGNAVCTKLGSLLDSWKLRRLQPVKQLESGIEI